MMSATWLLALRNLGGSRFRLLAAVGGVALALSLSLALDAIYNGVANQLTTYIDESGADVWVSQAGVRNLHMVASWMPESVVDEVRSVEGVADVTPILYSTDTISAGDERAVAYVIGLPADAAMGAPTRIVEGIAQPGRGEIVVDAGFARRAGVSIGGEVTVLGRSVRIVGLSEGTASLVNSVAWVAFDDFRAMRGDSPVVSYVLVRVVDGASPDEVAGNAEETISGVTAQSRAAFSSEERRLVMDMSADVIAIMSVVGFVVSLAVVALTVYVATLARRREYGALKALGAPNRYLYGVVLGQAFVSVAFGFAVGLAFTAVLGFVVARTGINLELALSGPSVAKVGIVAVFTASLAALLPIRQIAGLDPADVLRKGAPQ